MEFYYILNIIDARKRLSSITESKNVFAITVTLHKYYIAIYLSLNFKTWMRALWL